MNMKTKIKAEVVAHSVNKQGDELLSLLITFPRIVLAEVNTHRMLSKNTSSSRAIPAKKMIESIENDPFIPVAWQKAHSGMQGSEYLVDRAADLRNQQWLIAKDNALELAAALSEDLHNLGDELVSEPVTKQLANRLLEPFMWTTMLITGPKSGWENFFRLRCPIYELGESQAEIGTFTQFRSKKDALKVYPKFKDEDTLFWLKTNKGQAEIHIMELAECIWDSYNESTPKVLKPGDWHIPFEDKIKQSFALIPVQFTIPDSVRISTAMAARTSYTTVGEEKELSLSDFVEGFEYEMKEGFSDGTVKNQEDFDKAKWVSQIYSDFHFSYIERIFNGKNKQNGLFGLRHKQKGIDYETMIGLHDRLLTQKPPHSSPLEHCAKCMTDEEYFHFTKTRPAFTEEEWNKGNEVADFGWCNNFKGFIPYRYMIDNNIKD